MQNSPSDPSIHVSIHAYILPCFASLKNWIVCRHCLFMQNTSILPKSADSCGTLGMISCDLVGTNLCFPKLPQLYATRGNRVFWWRKGYFDSSRNDSIFLCSQIKGNKPHSTCISSPCFLCVTSSKDKKEIHKFFLFCFPCFPRVSAPKSGVVLMSGSNLSWVRFWCLLF